MIKESSIQVDFKGLIEKARVVNQINRISIGMTGSVTQPGKRNGCHWAVLLALFHTRAIYRISCSY